MTRAEVLIPDLDDLARVEELTDERIREFERLCMAVAILGELTYRGLAVISGLGEPGRSRRSWLRRSAHVDSRPNSSTPASRHRHR